MKIAAIDIDQRPLVVAEIGANHEGDVEAAKTMIREAAHAGADAVKFQTYRAQRLVARTETARFAHFERLALPEAAYADLAREATAQGVLFLSTPFDLEAVGLLDPLVPAFKVASGDLTFTPLLERIARCGKPILLSTGMAAEAEIGAALDTIQHAGGLSRRQLADAVILLHCVSSYPTRPEEANLRAIVRLREIFGLRVGYSDHTLGILGCVAAVALGACVIEKHFTLQKEGRTFRDHQLSADPAELRQLVAQLKMVTSMQGDGIKAPQPSERENRRSMRRSLAARVDLKAGDVIRAEHLTCLRPATGLAPSELARVIGRRAARDIPAGHLIEASALVGKPQQVVSSR